MSVVAPLSFGEGLGVRTEALQIKVRFKEKL